MIDVIEHSYGARGNLSESCNWQQRKRLAIQNLIRTDEFVNSQSLGSLDVAQSERTAQEMALKPVVLLISLAGDYLFAEIHEHCLETLYNKAHVIQALNSSAAIEHLTASDPAGILVTDAHITYQENREVLAKVVEYAKSGKPVVIGGTFSAFMPADEMANFFNNTWGLPWSSTSYTRASLSYNPAVTSLFEHEAQLPNSIDAKSLYLKGFTLNAAVYLPGEDSHVSSTESPILYTRIGEGYLGYIGDIDGESEVTDVVLAMLRI